MKYFIPSKSLAGQVTSSTSTEFWPYDDGSGDPYWEGGASPKPYRWELSIDITTQSHSSHLTRVPNQYTGMDVNVGNWLSSGGGIALKIISVISKTDSTVTVIVEDVFRHNLFKSQTARGIFSVPASVVIYELNEDGIPLLDPLPATVTFATSFYPNVMSRHNQYSDEDNVLLEQVSHGFAPRDIVAVDNTSNQFVKATSDNRIVVGRVSENNLSPDSFTIDPVGKVVELDSLIGDIGDIVYTDGNQLVTTDTQVPIYIKLKDYTNTTIRGTSSGPTTSGNVIKVNGVDVTISGTGTVSDVVSDINALTSSHNVTASSVTAELSVSSTEGYSYGQIAAFVTNSPQISINGVTVTLTTTTTGDELYPGTPNLAVEQDMAVDINAASIPDVVAEVTAENILTIKNTTGGTLTLTNIDNDANGNPIFSPSAGTASCTALVEGSYGPSTDVFLFLEGPDASEITLVNNAGNTTNILSDLGIYSAENGIKAKALYIAEGLRKGENYMALNNTQRESLNVIVGDGVYVEDGGNGEWQYWLYTSTGWELIATEDSARTDADVLSLQLTNADTGTHLIGTVSNNSRVTNVTIEVTQAFDDINSTLNVGDATVNNRLMSEDIIDLTEVGTYTFTPSYVYDGGGDTDLNAYLNTGTSTVGTLKIIISYS